MEISIFRNNIELVKVKPSNASEIRQLKQSHDYVNLEFTLTSYVVLQVGDAIYIPQTNRFYYLNDDPIVDEKPNKYDYECTFEGEIHELEKVKCVLLTEKDDGTNYTDYNFPLTGNAQTFLYFITEQLNRIGLNITAGTFKSTDTITVDFNNWNCFQAITELSTLLNFEWYLENNILNFDAKNKETAYVFRTGENNGLLNLRRIRKNTTFFPTVVWGFGGTNNMPPRTADEGTTYDSDCLTDNRLVFDGDDGYSKLSKNTDIYGIREEIKEFEDIYPEYTGVITSVSNSDNKIFYDTNITFDINEYLLSGITPKLNFTSGYLVGKTFNIAFEYSSKKITLELQSDESGSYPNDIQLPKVGDTFKLFDLYLPQSYIDDAVSRLQTATQTYLDESSKPLSLYEAELDEEFIRANNISLTIGDKIRIVSSVYNIDALFEIKELTQNINNSSIYTIKFGDYTPTSLYMNLKYINFNTSNSIYSVKKNTYTTNQTINQITTIDSGSSDWETWEA